MDFLIDFFSDRLKEITGFTFVGLPIGLAVGYYVFFYSQPPIEVSEYPNVRSILDMDATEIKQLLPEIPLWVKNPEYEKVDCLNKSLLLMWPYLEKAICAKIRSFSQPTFDKKYMWGMCQFEFLNLSLGTLPPFIHGMKVIDTNEGDLITELACKWASNTDIVLEVQLCSKKISVQLVDVQVSFVARATFKRLVSTLPCFSTIAVSLMDKPQVDFGLLALGGDIMSIPGLTAFIQETIQNRIQNLYLWPQTFEIPVLDVILRSKKPVGLLLVKVQRGIKLLRMDIFGQSDPFVKVSLTGDSLAFETKKKEATLNPVWDETFQFKVKDPQSQTLEVACYNWRKIGRHQRIGVQSVPLKLLTTHEKRQFTIDLLKPTKAKAVSEHQPRGQVVIEMMYMPFLSTRSTPTSTGPGLLSVRVDKAKNLEGVNHCNPYATVIFKGDRKETKIVKKNRYPVWKEEFEFPLSEPPVRDMIRIEVWSKRTGIVPWPRESLGSVNIYLADVVYDGHINRKYDLMDSKRGKLHVQLVWKTVV